MDKIKYPKGETVCVSYYNTKHELCFTLTQKIGSDFYVLYECSDGKLNKLGKSQSPLDLEEKFQICQKLK